MDDVKSPEGIDFFDFLYETWQAKWIFIGILLLPVFLAGILAVATRPDNDVPADTIPTAAPTEVFSAVIPFRIDPVFEPYRRSSEELWQNLKTLLPEIDGPPLVDDNFIPEGTERPDNVYLAKISNYNGFLYVALKNGKLELAENIRAAFTAAAKLQFETTKEQVVTNLKLLDAIPAGVFKDEKAESDAYFREYYLYSRFLSLPGVVKGTHRFLDFHPALAIPGSEIPEVQTPVAKPSNNSFIKMMVLGAIVGFVLACVFIMFRIAIKRKNLGAAKA